MYTCVYDLPMQVHYYRVPCLYPLLSSYLVATINEAQALVIIEHEGDFYNLYLSDDSGIFYSLSLRDLVIEEDPLQIDLELVSGFRALSFLSSFM